MVPMVPIETKGGKKRERERERRERGGDFCLGLMFCVFFAKR